MKGLLKTGIFFLLTLCIFIISACNGEDDSNKEQVKDAEKEEVSKEPITLRLEGNDWGFPSPFTHNPRGPGAYNMHLIYDGLIEKDEKGIIPWLAKEWKISDDGKTYTFILRDDVKWHDGKPFTAEDVAFTFNYYEKHKPVQKSIFSGEESIVESVEVVSDHEVKVTVKQVAVTNLEKLGWARIIPKHIWENIDNPSEQLDKSILIGTGPFILDDYKKEEGAYRYIANENFWGPKPAVGAIEQIPVSDPALAFEQGEIDYAVISPDVVKRFENNPDYKIEKDPPYFATRLMFNMTEGPLADKKVRQAILYAIDEEEIIDKVLRGAAVKGNAGYLSPENLYYNDKVKQYDYDIEKAKELLGGKTYKFTLKTANTATAKLDVKVAELLKLQLEKVGIEIEVIASDLATNDEYIKTGNYELALQSTGGYGQDPDMLREVFSVKKQANSVSGTVLLGFNNEKLEQLGKQQLVELDDEKRRAILDEMQEIIAEEAYVYPLYYKTNPNVIRKSKYDGFIYMYDHHWAYHAKLSYLEKE